MKNMKKKTKPRHTKAGLSILAGLKEIQEAYASGEPLSTRFNIRTVEVDEPGEYDAAAIVALRRRLGVSQAVFAKLVGASVALAQSWEQGRRVPDAMGRRLLDEISREPKRWAGMIHASETRAA